MLAESGPASGNQDHAFYVQAACARGGRRDCKPAVQSRFTACPLEGPTAFASILNAVTSRVALDSEAVISQTQIHPEPVRRTRKDRHIGADPLYSEDFLRRVGLSDVPVLLHGETGAGKEVMARKLWAYSNRVGKPFLKLNCAAVASELIESELFGYERGAFTGAMMDKPGKFELAQDGTILLDEIGDMDTHLQAKFCRYCRTVRSSLWEAAEVSR